MKITPLGIDIARRGFHVFGAEARGQVVVRNKLTRKRLTEFVVNVPVPTGDQGTENRGRTTVSSKTRNGC